MDRKTLYDEGIIDTTGCDYPKSFESSAPAPIDPKTGQHECYWVLSEEERKKGFVRPVRNSYRHVGIRPKYPVRDLTNDELIMWGGAGYVKYEEYPEGESDSIGRFWTKEELNSGCGTVTTMNRALSETYAANPKFYGATFCVNCNGHFLVEEFVWEGTNEMLGS